MSTLLNVTPRQYKDECQFLEKNYLNCILQKALKDKTPNNNCNLEHVLHFHTECPDYVKKYDHPEEGKDFLKKQMFYMLSYPFYKFRQEKSKTKIDIQDINKQQMYLEYPEMNMPKNKAGPEANLIINKNLRNTFSEGAEYTEDISREEE